MWSILLRESLPSIRAVVPPESKVLEVGYGDGLLTCWLTQELCWRTIGFDVKPEAHDTAVRNAKRLGMTDRIDFRLCGATDTRRHVGAYDAVFAKTVFYSSESLEDYADWLDWILSVLRPGGWLVNFETGRANALVDAYRRLRRRSYADSCLYSPSIEKLYDERFEDITRRYTGGISQFFSPLPGVYEMARAVERSLRPRTASNSFAVSILARRPLTRTTVRSHE